MEQAQKMAELKKVFAEVLLNTTTESASRVLAAELKAAGLQQSLSAFKVEALAMVLRVKAVMDSKIKEAEKQSLNHLKRIQELEAKLQEAETTINYLQAELSRAMNKLEQQKNGSAISISEHNSNSLRTFDMKSHLENNPTSDLKTLTLRPGNMSDARIPFLDQKIADSCCCHNGDASGLRKDFFCKKRCAGNPDLASIIMRRKEPELYKNGCTQRIRAFGQNLLAAKVYTEQSGDQFSKNELSLSKKVKAKNIYSSDYTSSVQVKRHTKASKILQQAKICRNDQANISSWFCLRRQRTRSLKKINSDTSLEQNVEDNKSSNRSSSNLDEQFKMTKIAEDLVRADMGEMDPNADCRNAQDRKNCPDISFFVNQSVELLPCGNGAETKHNVMEQSNLDMEHENLEKSESSRKNIHEGCALNEPDQTGEVEPAIFSDGVHTQKNTCKQGGTTKAESQRFLKYTFQRKRKRESLNEKDETSTDKRMTSSSLGENQNSKLTHQQPNLIKESLRNDRRIVQVARQLVSLSAKRW